MEKLGVAPRRIAAAIFISMLVGLPGTLTAGHIPGAATFTLFGGGYSFEGNQGLSDQPAYGAALGYNFNSRWSAEGVFTLVQAEEDGFEADIYSARLDLLAHFFPEGRFVPYVALGLGGSLVETGEIEDFHGLANYGVGFKAFLTERVAFRGDVRHILDVNVRDGGDLDDLHHNLLYSAGLTVYLGGTRLAPPPAAERVAPPAPKEAPGPAQPPPAATVPSTTPETGSSSPQTVSSDRVPPPPPVDTDSDGVPDDRDKCPNTPWGEVNEFGCPTDSDGDGVDNTLDRCPGTPLHYRVDQHGCPRLRLSFEFSTGQAHLPPGSDKELKKAADFIAEYPEMKFLIEGHTDSVGSQEANLRMSRRRAEAVREALVETFGISPARLEVRGFGETRPVADNATQEGRRQNRRVTIAVISGP